MRGRHIIYKLQTAFTLIGRVEVENILKGCPVIKFYRAALEASELESLS